MTLSLIGFAVLLAMAFLGVPLGLSLIAVGVIGFAWARADMVNQALFSWGDAGFEINARAFNAAYAMAGQQMFDVATSYALTVIPLFVLMGAFIHRSQLSQDLYDAANAFLGHRRGGLAMGTIAACAGFAAVCGSSIATAATVSRVAMPSMRRFGYDDALSTGSIAAGGTLGILIPPSVPMVLYGLLSETDIAKLFIAGILPGLLLTMLFFLAIGVTTMRNPAAGPRADKVPWRARMGLLARVWGIVVIFVVIIGGIYLGIFTATEAAGIGVVTAALFAVMRGRLTPRSLWESLVETGITTGMIFVVAIGALIFSNFVNLAGFTREMSAILTGLEISGTQIVLCIVVMYLLMGCVFDSLAMLTLTVPVIAAILKPMGVDMIWFGIVAVIAVELGLITPPVGINVFVVKAATEDVSIWTIFRGVAPFVVAMLALLVAVLIFPQIATLLPALMGR
ncbi:TRAP transporter large permease [Paracoccus sp. (in: a-proteobacteria)]|uniref:TRAP transporter large permease n=1 Tax=Paracoccus sp. TaxID=267 RepID=UPI003A8451DD